MNQDLLYKYFKGNATIEEEKQILDWVDASDENRKTFQKERMLYDIALFSNEKQSIHANNKARIIPMLKWTTRIAAMIAIVWGCGFLFKDYQYSRLAQLQTVTVPAGQRAQITLADGTKVWLNSQSTLTYASNFGRQERNVSLDGEAYFQVAKDSLKPFLVHVDKYCIRVLGTSFNVSAYSGDKTWYTTLVEGAIAVGGIGNEIRMSPCEQLCIDTDSGQCELREVNPELYTSWVGGKFYFKAYTFEELVRRLQRWYDFDVLYRDEGIRQRRFSGVINKYRPLGEMLEFLEMTSDVCFELNGKTIIVSKKK